MIHVLIVIVVTIGACAMPVMAMQPGAEDPREPNELDSQG